MSSLGHHLKNCKWNFLPLKPLVKFNIQDNSTFPKVSGHSQDGMLNCDPFYIKTLVLRVSQASNKENALTFKKKEFQDLTKMPNKIWFITSTFPTLNSCQPFVQIHTKCRKLKANGVKCSFRLIWKQEFHYQLLLTYLNHFLDLYHAKELLQPPPMCTFNQLTVG